MRAWRKAPWAVGSRANGPLKKDYIFHATADAPSRGGKAQIVIHQRDPTQPNPRGAKAYLVSIDPTGESSATIKTENLKMTDAFAAAMTDDVGALVEGRSRLRREPRRPSVGCLLRPTAAELRNHDAQGQKIQGQSGSAEATPQQQ